MSDSKVLFDVEATLQNTKTGSKENVKLHFLADKKKVKETPETVMKTQMEEMLKQVSITPVFGVFNNVICYDYNEEQPADVGNTRVEVNLPYCLHIPNDLGLLVQLDVNETVNVLPKKVWTEAANGSSEVDVFAEGKTTYFQKSSFETGKIPQKAVVGWDLKNTGQNVQKIMDTAGVFRYTKLQIFFNTSTPADTKDPYKILEKEINKKALKIVNRVLDAYRFITNESFIERLSFLNIVDVYFYEHRTGFHPTSPNIEAAIINRSHEEIDQIMDMLSSNTQPPLYELLLLNSKRSFQKNMLTLALVESFQALEIFLENTLRKKFTEQGVKDDVIEQKLDQTWRTKERLKELLKEATGHSLLEERTLWDKWCTIYDNDRNEVIHHGKESTIEETKNTLDLNDQVIAWIKKIL